MTGGAMKMYVFPNQDMADAYTIGIPITQIVEIEHKDGLWVVKVWPSAEHRLVDLKAELNFWKLNKQPLTEAEVERGYIIAKRHGIDVDQIRDLVTEVAALKARIRELEAQ